MQVSITLNNINYSATLQDGDVSISVDGQWAGNGRLNEHGAIEDCAADLPEDAYAALEAGLEGIRNEPAPVIKNIITTRHAAFADYLRTSGIAPKDAVFFPRAGAEDVRGCRVFGPLPLHLAALAAEVVHVPIDMSGLPRDYELTHEEFSQRVGAPETYVVRKGS